MELKPYLESSEFIDWEHPEIYNLALQLSADFKDQNSIINNCFTFVRDNIKHSYDFKLNPITCKASDVLKHQTGYCYAKSHLLAALLRANKVPTALCYQRLSIDDKGTPFCLHGLNAVYLKGTGWYKMDARGNKEGISAQFSPPVEQLAFPIRLEGEFNLDGYYSEPFKKVIDTLSCYMTYQQVADNLPDIE